MATDSKTKMQGPNHALSIVTVVARITVSVPSLTTTDESVVADMDFAFDHPFLTAILLAVGLGVPAAVFGGRRTIALLQAMQERFGGEIVRRRISPSELRIASADRLLIFSSFLGSTDAQSGSRSPASVYARIFFLLWKQDVPHFALRRRDLGIAINRKLGIERRKELTVGDPKMDEEYFILGEREDVVPYLLAITDDLLELHDIAGSHDVSLRLSLETPPQENTWKPGDPIVEVVSDEEIEASKVACLSLHVDGKPLRSEEASARILTTAQRFAVGLEAMRGALV